MTTNIFMSYSRREVSFVDDLVGQLETKGYNVWLDYRTLIPGTPWTDQIKAGLENSDTVLLVVSKASLASEYVELEWRHFLETNKRFILLIFEAVDLPPELEKYEWVDFRSSFEKGLTELLSQLAKPVQEEHPVPERGFKVPGIVWLAAGLAAIVAVYAFSVLWALFVPWFLIPLAYRIFKRSFNFIEVQTALWLLPVSLLLTSLSVFDVDQEASDMQFQYALVSLPLVFVLWRVLRSPAMQRWGKPEATIPKFANPYTPDVKAPRSVTFFIDHAPQDRIVANEMTTVFEKYGHVRAADINSAQVVISLISIYQTDTAADPQTQVVFPVLLQSVVPSKKLSKIQWIDFRSGVRNLDAMAQLIPEPAKLLKALGIRPLGNQLILPPIIMTMRYYILLLGIFTVGAVMQYWDQFWLMGLDQLLGDENTGSILLSFLFNILLLGVLIFFMLRHLVQRKGWFASFINFSLGLFTMGILLAWQFNLDTNVFYLLQEVDASAEPNIAIFFPIAIYIIGGVVMAIFFFRRRRDIQRWFPARMPKKAKA